ncbi:MAG: hypothetical protein ABFE02_06780 [Sulfuricella sp.]
MNNPNSHLIGLTILHQSLGVGVIHAISTRNEQEYFIAEFACQDDSNEFTLKEFRVELLTGWGGYFRDESAEINKRLIAGRAQ